MTDPLGHKDPSNDPPMEGNTFDRGNPARRCTAKLSDGSGDRCRNWAIKGGTVCRYHGGAVKRTIERARRRLAENADRGAKQLLKLAFDEKQSADIRLKATLQLLDRAGVNARTAVDIEISASPFQQIEETVFTQLAIGGSRAEFRRSQGIEDDSDEADPLAQLHANDVREAMRNEPTRAASGVLDVFVVDVNDTAHEPYPDTPDAGVRGASERTASHTPPSGGMTVVEAAEAVQRQNEQNARWQGTPRDNGHAKIHPLRALPPGRSDR